MTSQANVDEVRVLTPSRDDDQDIAGGLGPAWSQRATAHIGHLQGQANRILVRATLTPADKAVVEKINTHLTAARQAATNKRRFRSRWSGGAEDRTYSNVHKAEVKLLKLAQGDELAWFGPSVLAQTRQHLGKEDPRRTILEDFLAKNNHQLRASFKEVAVGALLAAHDAEETERARVRSFRNILAMTTCATAILAVLFVVWGFAQRSVLPPNVCFKPTSGTVCPLEGAPDGNDVMVLEAVGAAAAALAGALAIRKIQGTSTPQAGYSVPVFLILLRVPVGALAALLGILVIHGGFIPGLSNLDNGPQIIAWAIAFGILQESVTRAIDRQGHRVLNNVRGPAREIDEKDTSE